MKIFAFSSDAQGFTDGVTTGQLIDHLPNRVTTLAQADVAVVVAVCHAGFKYNHAQLNALRASGKPWVLIDYLEYGWDWDFELPNTIKSGACPCTQQGNFDWAILTQFVREYPPILEFKRELRNADVRPNRIPIDFLAAWPKPPVVSLADYSSRPYDVTYVWGYSHPLRAKMHGQIFQAMGEKNTEVLSSFEMLDGRRSHAFTCPVWVSIFTPYWVRQPMDRVLRLQEQGRIAVCLPGAGFKCFREQEAPHGTVMAMLQNDLARSYPWEHGVNALILSRGHEFENLFNYASADRPWLYDIYRRGQSTLDMYRREFYIPNYVIPNIKERL